MPDLTEQARANLESGATDGAGTGTCRGCGGDKEPSRLNSNRCRTCQGRPARVTPPTRPLRLDLPVDVWNRLSELATAEGMALATYARHVLTAHALGEQVSEEPDTPVTPAQWARLVKWVQQHPTEWAGYTGPRDTRQEADRAAIYRWFLEVSRNP